jgi:hypothetical protein
MGGFCVFSFITTAQNEVPSDIKVLNKRDWHCNFSRFVLVPVHTYCGANQESVESHIVKRALLGWIWLLEITVNFDCSAFQAVPDINNLARVVQMTTNFANVFGIRVDTDDNDKYQKLR